ncbi:brix domain-containing protein 1 [Culex quinquefasciatus]|uniref:Ribosome production factor 2 homolog n=2 Tax=Culex pipiens complex TaxID=518105 RepID=B0X4Q6_CULQU|nr:brix domain-containing protein 1 [Culex quinquefasciatus]|eukprot:XP_001864628.1 brix domain-containing protein 1 [Culex quinquefasciatus]
MSSGRIKKPVTRRGRRALDAREPKTIENPKKTLIMEGRKCSHEIRQALKDMNLFKKPLVSLMRRNNDVTMFEDATPLEQLAKSNDCHLFMFGSSSKKRPNNLIFGRIYDEQILDMVEFGIKQYKSLQDFKSEKISAFVKPVIVFNGYKWKLTEELRRIRSLLLDMFHIDDVSTIRLQGLEHVLSFTITEDLTILMRSYRIMLKKSGQRTPRIELSEMGPSMDLTIRRTKLASDDLYKTAMKQPAILKVAKRKNISRDELGNVHGRVHVGKQDINVLQTRKMKGLKKTAEERKADRVKWKQGKAAAAAAGAADSDGNGSDQEYDGGDGGMDVDSDE